VDAVEVCAINLDQASVFGVIVVVLDVVDSRESGGREGARVTFVGDWERLASGEPVVELCDFSMFVCTQRDGMRSSEESNRVSAVGTCHGVS
jgi:hypothetical protein